MPSTLPITTSTRTSTINSITDIYGKDRSILVNLVGKIPDCSKLNTNLAITIKNEVKKKQKNLKTLTKVYNHKKIHF